MTKEGYIFVASFDENNFLNGIFVNSDRERHKALYFIEMHQIIDFFEEVGKDYPSSGLFIFDKKLGDYRVLNLSRDDTDFIDKVKRFNWF